MNFLNLESRRFLVFGVANRKSLAWHVAACLEACGATVVYVVHTASRRDSLAKLLDGREVHICDVGEQEQIDALAAQLREEDQKFDGMVHSIAWADYSAGFRPFHETPREAFLRTVDVSCWSLVALSNALRDMLAPDASVVTISISTTRMASEKYGYMAPVKAALESAVVFLAKSFSSFSEIRFNAVCPGLLKTSSSAGIPGYVDAYLYAEQVIPRHRAVTTEEAAATACFLLSPRSSGINAQSIVVDAGMSINYFDDRIIGKVMGSDR
jgi:enoyl-[acyl-carrier protein] reductase I